MNITVSLMHNAPSERNIVYVGAGMTLPGAGMSLLGAGMTHLGAGMTLPGADRIHHGAGKGHFGARRVHLGAGLSSNALPPGTPGNIHFISPLNDGDENN